MKQVLLIEPGFYPRVLLDDELSPHGYQVVSTKTVRNALIKMKTQVFQLVIISYDDQIDLALQLLYNLRESFNQIPVVILSKQPTEKQLIQLLNFRPIDFVVKPYSMVDLLARMESLLKAKDEEKK